MRIPRNPLLSAMVIMAIVCGAAQAAEPPSREEVVAAMKQAAAFLMEELAYRGGVVRLYTEDGSEQWGEIPARKTMIWVEDPGTPGVGRASLEAYRASGDAAFLEYAKRSANALIYGQHPAGGWHYFIDFDPSEVPGWYEEVASKCWGWEEYYHYYGNCTFDDKVTTGAAEFLLDLYMTTLDPAYRGPLLRALDFILEAQYPIGGWPQRYPLEPEHPYEGLADYTAYHTFNDDVIGGNIFFLLKAYRLLGNEAYREAALRGMRFVAMAQQPPPQAGWAQQYDMELRPRRARNAEPKGLATGLSVQNIQYLMDFYRITGDRSFLRGIPDALDWLERAVLPEGHSDAGHTHAYFVEIGTDRPLYPHREGSTHATGRYWTDYNPVDILPGYGYQIVLNVPGLRQQYEQVAAMEPEQAKASYEAEKVAPAAPAAPAAQAVPPERVAEILAAMDARGAWVEDLSVPNFENYIEGPARAFRGISVRTYINNMTALIQYLKGISAPEKVGN